MATISLRCGSQLPRAGFGCWKLTRDSAAQHVYDAIKVGYRHIDSACDYANEKEVGAGIARAISEGLCTRSDLWVTSKLWCTFHRPERVEEAITRTLSDLGLAYLDLYLIHFPIPLRYVDPSVRYPPEWMYDPLEKRMHEDPVPLADTWRAMAALKAKGLARHIGVCNFSTPLLRDLAHAVPESPVEVLQVELHPFLVQEKLVRFCKERGIVVTAFSPLGASSYVPLGMATAADSALVAPTVVAIATRLGVTPAQVLLGWASHRGLSAIPKSSSVERMKENLAGADVAITDADAAAIAALDQHRRYNDPGVFAERFFGSFAPIYD